jgi:hypothetical protein
VTFDAGGRPEPIMVQHMFAGVNAHIGLDLGIAAEAISSGPQLFTLREDFDRINAVLASQVTGLVEDINELSPVLADLYAVLRNGQINLINDTVQAYRDDAWIFATILAATPGLRRSRRDRGARSADRPAGGVDLQTAPTDLVVHQRDRRAR